MKCLDNVVFEREWLSTRSAAMARIGTLPFLGRFFLLCTPEASFIEFYSDMPGLIEVRADSCINKKTLQDAQEKLVPAAVRLVVHPKVLV